MFSVTKEDKFMSLITLNVLWAAGITYKPRKELFECIQLNENHNTFDGRKVNYNQVTLKDQKMFCIMFVHYELGKDIGG